MKILEAVEMLRENPASLFLVDAIVDCFDYRLDDLEDKNDETLEDEIDAVSELADLMFAVKEECKVYAKAVKTDSEADDTDAQEIINELEDYLEAYEDNFGNLDKLTVEL